MRHTPQEFAEAIGGFRREVAGLLRRMVIGTVGGSIWQLLGHKLLDQSKRETRNVELFHGIGIFARPPSGSKSAEAIMAQPGGPNGQVIIATRDEATRSKVDDIANDETALHNSQSRMYVKNDGTIEGRTHGGVAHSLTFEADFAAIVNILATWVVVPNDGGAALKAAINAYITSQGGSGAWPKGTQKLKGE